MEQLHRNNFVVASSLVALFAVFAASYYVTTALSALGISGQFTCSVAYVLLILVAYALMRMTSVAAPSISITTRRLDPARFVIYVGVYMIAFIALISYVMPSLGIKSSITGFGPSVAQTGIVLVVVAVSEEFVFRGFVFNILRRSMNLDRAVIISAAVFAGFHIFTDASYYQCVTAFASQFALGIILAMIYFASGNLLYSIIAHWISDFTVIDCGCLNAGAGSSVATFVLMVVPLLLVTALFRKNSSILWKTSDAKYAPLISTKARVIRKH